MCCIVSMVYIWNAYYGITGYQVFKRGVQNWKDFCLKINIPEGNYWILRIGQHFGEWSDLKIDII